MSDYDYGQVNARLSSVPGYQDALSGVDFGFGFPTGPDGRVLPGFRVENARALARSRGADAPGVIDPRTGRASDPDAGPGKYLKYWGPLAVGGSAAIIGALAGGAGAVAGAGSVAKDVAGVEAATQDAVAGPLGSLAAKAAPAAVAAKSLKDKIKEKLTDPKSLAALAFTIPALVASRQPPGSEQTDAATNALLQEALKRSRRVDPLHQAVTQLAFSRLPTSARNGVTLTGE